MIQPGQQLQSYHQDPSLLDQPFDWHQSRRVKQQAIYNRATAQGEEQHLQHQPPPLDI